MVNKLIIKHTARLIKADLRKIFIPSLWLLKGAVAGTGFLFFNGIGKKMFNQFESSCDYNYLNFLNCGAWFTGIIVFITFLILSVMKGMGLFKLVLVTNCIGVLGMLIYYVNDKKDQAKYYCTKLPQNKEKIDIKIEEKKEKEVPKLTLNRINT